MEKLRNHLPSINYLRPMNIDLLLALLRSTLGGPVSVGLLSEETRMPAGVVKQNLLGLARKGLVTTIDGKEFETSGEQRLSLAVLALREGADMERVCKALGWREFEDLVALALDQKEFEVKKHFRFKRSRRYEIDVVGLKEPLVLSVECKHWKRSWRRAATIDAVRAQVDRTRALAQSLPEPRDRLGVARWGEVRFMPLVLTLSNTPLKICDGVPVVPIFHFNSFLNEMKTYMDELMTFSAAKPNKIS